MSVNKGCLKNTQNSFQMFGNKLQKGGGGCNAIGSAVTMTSLNNAAQAGMGYSRAVGIPYQHIDEPQSGGAGYAFDDKSAALAAEFKGSYPAYSSYKKPSQCGGRRRKRRSFRKRKKKRRKKTKKHRGGKRKKSRRKRRKSRKRRRSRGGKRRKSRRKRRTGTLSTLGSQQMGGSTVSYSLGSSNPQKPWALANNSYGLNEKSCFDNYNHFKKN